MGVPLSDGRSLVAGANALFRAAESRRDRPIVRDAFAGLFAEGDPRVRLVRALRFAVPSLRRALGELQVAHCVRHRAIDALVLRAIDDGFRQVVLIGAGYDMRASRFRERGARWIEVDAPATQAEKARVLSAHPGVRGHVERTSVDLMHGSLEDALRRTSFDPALPTCFVAEGVVHYLSLPRFDDLLAGCTRGPGPVRLVLSFIRTEMIAHVTPTFARLVKLVREVPRLHLFRAELEAACARQGLVGLLTWDFEQQVDAFAPEAKGRVARLTQDVAQVERR